MCRTSWFDEFSIFDKSQLTNKKILDDMHQYGSISVFISISLFSFYMFACLIYMIYVASLSL
jgi:hypothetical protein